MKHLGSSSLRGRWEHGVWNVIYTGKESYSKRELCFRKFKKYLREDIALSRKNNLKVITKNGLVILWLTNNNGTLELCETINESIYCCWIVT